MQNVKSEVDIEKGINSFYVFKNIFSFLSEKQNLDIIIYYKQLQKKLYVDIKD